MSLVTKDYISKNVLLFFICAVFLFFALKDIGTAFWLDETWRIQAAKATQLSFFDSPSLWVRQFLSYEGLLRLLILFGADEEWHFRLPSLLAALVSLFLTYSIGLSYFDKWFASFAAAFLSSNAIFVYQSIEVAPYSLAMLVYLALVFYIVKTKPADSLWIKCLFILLAFMLHFYIGILALITFLISHFSFLRKHRVFFIIILAAGLIGLLQNLNLLEQILDKRNPDPKQFLVMAEQIFSSIISMSIVVTNRWLPEFSIYIFSTLAILFLNYFFNFTKISSYLKLNKTMASFFLVVCLYALFLSLQAIITLQSFPRYFLAALPVVYIFLVYILSKGSRLKSLLVCGIIYISFIISWSLGNVTQKIRPNILVVSQYAESLCGKDSKLFVPEMFEVPLYLKYFQDNSMCELVVQPAYIRYFEKKDFSDIYSTSSIIEQDRWLIDNIKDRNHVILIGQRSLSRMNAIIDNFKDTFAIESIKNIDSIYIFSLKKLI